MGVPARLTLWLKAPGVQDWTEIRLGPLFGKMNDIRLGTQELR
jgi:hypothetical protein